MLDKALSNYKSEALKVVQSLDASKKNPYLCREEITVPLTKIVKHGSNFNSKKPQSLSNIKDIKSKKDHQSEKNSLNN